MTHAGVREHLNPQLSLVKDSTVEPVSTSDAKSHLRVSSTSEDSLIGGYVKAARQSIERWTARPMVNQDWKLQLDDFPIGDIIPLHRVPLASTSITITYHPSSGGSKTLSGTSFFVDTDAEPGRVVLKSSESWPSTDLRDRAAVDVQFTAGYGTSSTDTPRAYRQAVFLTIGHWYENRQSVTLDGVPREVPQAAKHLLWSYRHSVSAGEDELL